MIYLDNAASTPLVKETLEISRENIEIFYANPHSDHPESHKCRQAISKAQIQLLNCIHANADNAKVLWTSGGTEANNMILQGLDLGEGDHVITSVLEHPSILNPLKELESRSVNISQLSINKNGLFDLELFAAMIKKETRLISLISVQNETGVILNLQEIRDVLNQKNCQAHLHIDNVQGFGKIKLDWQKLRIDSMSLGGHKFHGPNSAGALIIRPELKLRPLFYGGGQQDGYRPGTQDPAAIVTLAQSAEFNHKNKDAQTAKIKKLNELCRDKIQNLTDKKGQAVQVTFNSPENASPYVLNVALKGYQGAAIMRFLGEKNVIIGVGSACSTGSNKPSRVLTEMGIDADTAFSSLRISFGWQNIESDINIFIEKLQEVLRDY